MLYHFLYAGYLITITEFYGLFAGYTHARQGELQVVDSFRSFLVRNRLPIVVLTNVALTFLGYFLALGLRFDFNFPEFVTPHRLVFPALLLMTFRLAAYMYWDLNRGYWRYVSTRDLVAIVKAHLITSLLLAAAFGLFRIPSFPRSVVFIEFVVSIVLMGGLRFVVRVFSDQFLTDFKKEGSIARREVIVLGGGDSGHLVVKNLISNRRFNYDPVAILDDSDNMQGVMIQGVPVEGRLGDLRMVLSRYPAASAVVIAIPTLAKQKYEAIKKICTDYGVLVKKLQAFEDIACLDVAGPNDDLSIEMLLEKEVHVAHEAEISEELRGKRIVVTGAGGSIGSELVRQILEYKPEKLILVDHSEFSLFSINQELSVLSHGVTVVPVIGNVGNEARMLSIFQAHKPEFVFHAAAYKHVPLMEDNACEAFVNNVIGTRNILRVSHLCAVKRFVLISTDKAVDPSSVMGCSKRLAELLVQEYSHSDNRPAANLVQTAVVRFGNVINSAGSVIPLFKQQILSGGPVTVTHPEMERYFMSIREAVRLVLTAGVLGEQGEIYVLDMGRPIKVVDVAKKMLALYGRRDIDIQFTGIRAGEKLTEVLTSDEEETFSTQFEKVSRLSAQLNKGIRTNELVREIEAKLEGISNSKLIDRMFSFVSTEKKSTGGRTTAI